MDELKISDLSVGDWVMVEGEDWKVSAINSDSVGLRVGNDYAIAEISELSGIPLTPEILKKNRLDFKDFAFQEITMLGRHIRRIAVSTSDSGWWIHVSIRKAGGHDFVDMVFAVDFIGQFVHELQHAIRLAGIEKEIEL